MALSPVMFGKASDEWETPQDFFAKWDARMGGFALDAAASPNNAKCRLWFGPGGLCEDALALKDWRVDDSGRAIWLNPPYSRCREFIAKAREQSLQGGMPVVCLVPSRTDTRWWHEHVYYGDNMWWPGVEVHFVKGRLKFGCTGKADNSAPFPSVVIVFRPVTA